jgi:hypothetical protein
VRSNGQCCAKLRIHALHLADIAGIQSVPATNSTLGNAFLDMRETALAKKFTRNYTSGVADAAQLRGVEHGLANEE